MALRIKNPQVGDWDYDGWCRPKGPGAHWNNTFSVGIFKWIPKAHGSGIKRSAVVKRIRGYSSNPQEVYDKAEEWIVNNWQRLDKEASHG
jgi:hypothetical protein